jgi:D-lactate dehydrogenase
MSAIEAPSFLSALEKIIPSECIKTRPIDLYAYASDASFYYLVPKAVVLPQNVAEIRALFAFSQEHKIPLVFRAGGTNLSGQSVTDGILVDVSKHFRHIQVENNGEMVRVAPGVIGGYVNAVLKRFGKKMGPDPASISAAMMGGILSNNASGMCCGVAQNSYHTLAYMTLMLPNGLIFNTERIQDYHNFEQQSPDIFKGIQALRERILANTALVKRIRKKYQIKNTVGYCLNAFIDFEHPLDILAHLFIGGEGTLGFIAEAVLKTVPNLPHKITSLLYFENIRKACDAVIPLKESCADAVELLDWNSIKSIWDLKGAPTELKTLPEGAVALLTEYQAATESELDEKFAQAQAFFPKISLLQPAEFTKDTVKQGYLWKLRKGLLPSVAAVRKQKSAVILEDIAFPIEHLTNAVQETQALMLKHGYPDGVLMGHAKDGNLHFIIAQPLNDAPEIQKYADLMDDLAEIVFKYDGSFKGEHGTGRSVAAYVEAEWGGEAYEMMCAVKKLLDPDYLLNPDVLINPDPKAHLKNLRTMPVVESEVDKCMECGFCENRCPSRDLTLTPRQRIGIRRALQRLQADNQMDIYNDILKDFQYSGMDTCAVDGLCATDCPVDINTGDLIKRLRRENHSERENKIAVWVAKNMKIVEHTTRFGLDAGHITNILLGKKAMPNLTFILQKIFPSFPSWTSQLSISPTIPYTQSNDNHSIVYFATCISRMMGSQTDGKKSVLEAFMSVSKKAKIGVLLPENITGSCCGQAFSSKGFSEAYQISVNQTVEKLWIWSKEGKLPIILDLTSCTQSLLTARPYLSEANQPKFDALKIKDSIEYLHDIVLKNIAIVSKKDKIALHPVCSLGKMGLQNKLENIAQTCATEVFIPLNAGCCGMAGDRGFFVPALTKSATATESAEIQENTYSGYYSSARSCEMAMSEAVGKNYVSLLHLVDEVSG